MVKRPSILAVMTLAMLSLGGSFTFTDRGRIFQCFQEVGGGVADTEWVTGETLGSPSTDFTFRAGVQFTANSAITITSLGRWCISGNSQTHTLYLFDTTVPTPCATGSALASVSVNMSGATPGQFTYATLSSPVTLVSGRDYVIESDETAGGDTQYAAATVTTTAVGDLVKSVYSDANSCNTFASGQNWGPLSFKYH